MLQLGFELLVSLLFALAVASALIALPCAIAITIALNRLFRSRAERSMRTTSGHAVYPELHQLFPNGPQGELEIDQILSHTWKDGKLSEEMGMISFCWC
jgi:hypothetical protein